MKIECGWKNKKVDELDDGTLFYYIDSFYMSTDIWPDERNKMRYCLNLDNGELATFMNTVKVLVIEDATLKIGGYYK